MHTHNRRYRTAFTLTSIVVGVAMAEFAFGTTPKQEREPQYTIHTVAGNGERGFGGDEGEATSAILSHPTAVAVDRKGNLYIADNSNNRIRRVDTKGVITTVAGTGKAGFSGDGGQAVDAQLNRPYGVSVDAKGNLLIADTNNGRIRRVTPAGIISTLAGGGRFKANRDVGDGGQATQAFLWHPDDVQSDRLGNLYIADTDNNRVRKVTPNGIITTVAGTGKAGYAGDGGQATVATLHFPAALALDRKGNLYICDFGNQCIRKVDTKGIIQTIAGSGQEGTTPDGKPALGNPLSQPTGVAVDLTGHILFSDSGNERIRRISSKGTLETLAGTGARGFSGDGGVSHIAQIAVPDILASDSAGNIYIADYWNNRIRKLVPQSLPEETESLPSE